MAGAASFVGGRRAGHPGWRGRSRRLRTTATTAAPPHRTPAVAPGRNEAASAAHPRKPTPTRLSHMGGITPSQMNGIPVSHERDAASHERDAASRKPAIKTLPPRSIIHVMSTHASFHAKRASGPSCGHARPAAGHHRIRASPLHTCVESLICRTSRQVGRATAASLEQGSTSISPSQTLTPNGRARAVARAIRDTSASRRVSRRGPSYPKGFPPVSRTLCAEGRVGGRAAA